MNNQQIPLGAIPIIGQQDDRAQAAAHSLFYSMYAPLFPQLAIYRIAHGYQVEGGLTEDATPERIVAEAVTMVQAAMEPLGFKMRK